jgi:cyclophilin family peptidyl-prolyl cis-trans isomerase
MFAAAALAFAAAAAAHAAAAPTCKPAALPKPRTERRQPPKQQLDPRKHYDVTLVTNCGSFTIRLDVAHWPKTTASFLSLARSHYFDDTIFLRIVPTFVIQGGDPTQTQAGGPGYSIVETPPASTRYTKYTVAMAKAGNEPRGASGSQFFVVTGPAAATLTPDYAVVGHVYVGRKVVDLIGRLGSPQTEKPTRVIVVTRVVVKVS